MNTITIENKIGHTIKSKRPKTNNYIKSKHSGIMASFEMFDWVKAQSVLTDCNHNNRSVSESIVFGYKDEMINNNWKPAGDAIVFDINNELIDGQHRLHAIVVAHNQGIDINQEFLVIRDVTPDCYKYKDIGKTRSIDDAIEMSGKRKEIEYRDDITPKSLADALKHAIKILENKCEHRKKGSLVEPIELYKDEFIGLDDSVFFVETVSKKNNVTKLPKPQIAALHYFFAKKDKNMADEFITQALLGSNVDEAHVVYQIIAPNNGRIIKWKKNPNKKRAAGYGYFIEAWNAVRKGTPHKKLRFSSDFDYNPNIPEIF